MAGLLEQGDGRPSAAELADALDRYLSGRSPRRLRALPLAVAGGLAGGSADAAAALVAATGGQVRAKYGWTDVSRFAALGIPAVNYGPGDPGLAHRRDERVPVAQITAAVDVLRNYLRR